LYRDVFYRRQTPARRAKLQPRIEDRAGTGRLVHPKFAQAAAE
jgi:hypothetical protein